MLSEGNWLRDWVRHRLRSWACTVQCRLPSPAGTLWASVQFVLEFTQPLWQVKSQHIFVPSARRGAFRPDSRLSASPSLAPAGNLASALRGGTVPLSLRHI